MIPQLTYDVVEEIVAHYTPLGTAGDLARLCLVNRHFLEAGRRILYDSIDFYADQPPTSNRLTMRKSVLAHKHLGRYVKGLEHPYISPEAFEMLAFPKMPEFYDAEQVVVQWRALLAVCPNVRALTVFSLELAAVLAELRKWPLRVHSVEGAFTDAMLDFLAEQPECTDIILMADPGCLSKQPRPKPCCGIQKLVLSDAWTEISSSMLISMTVPSATTLTSLTIDINPDALLDFSVFSSLKHLSLRLFYLRTLAFFENEQDKRDKLQLTFPALPVALSRLSLFCPTTREGNQLKYSLFKHSEHLAVLPTTVRRLDFSGSIIQQELDNLLRAPVHRILDVLGLEPRGKDSDAVEVLADWCDANGYKFEAYEPPQYWTLP